MKPKNANLREKILIIGANGQLGSDIHKVFKTDFDVTPLTHNDLDVSIKEQVEDIVAKHKPEHIINTSAYHNVPDCETYPEKAFLVNAVGALNLMNICKALDITLVHISSDYVFDGKKKAPYVESDPPNPLNVYAVSKLAGEYFIQQLERFYIIRVASLFGITGCRAKGGGNFIETMLSLAKTKDKISVTSNIISSPTYTRDAAQQIMKLLKSGYSPGVYHVTNSGQCSWYEFALEIFKQAGIEATVEPREECAVVEGVARPLYSALESRKLDPLRPWQEALSAYLTERISQ